MEYLNISPDKMSIFPTTSGSFFNASESNFTLVRENSTENTSYYNNYYEYNNEMDPYQDYRLAINVSEYLSHFYTPTIVIFGSIGNILSVIVFFKTKLRKLSSSYYLAALGISDTVFLLVAFVTWLNFLSINIYNKGGYCEIFTYLSGLCSFLSVWFVVAFTIERYIAVLYPLKRQSMCTVKRACSVLICLVIVGCVLNIPLYMYASPVYSKDLSDYICDIKEDHKFHMQIYNYFDTAIVFVIPVTIIVILNTITAFAVWKVAGVRRKMTMTAKKKHSSKDSLHRRLRSQNDGKFDYSSVSALNACSLTIKVANKKSSNSSQLKVTKMLLIVSSVSVIFNLPSYIMRIKAYLIETDERNFMATNTTIIIQTISWFLFITNFGINFVLYCLSGQNFRKALVGMFVKKLKKEKVRHHEVVTTQMTVSEYLKSSNTSTKRHFITTSSSIGAYEIQEFNFSTTTNVANNDD